MSTDCVCECNWDDERPGFFREQRVAKARKAYTCVECREPIPAGTGYHYTVGKWDGHVGVSRTCLPCQGVRDDICPCAPSGCMRDDIFEQLGFDYITGELAEWAETE